MNPDTMDVQETMFIQHTVSAIGKLCPNQRRVPQFGSLMAETLVMDVLLVRLPVVIIVASPVLVELITGDCYADSKSHSLLMNCGSELFSLELFFDSAYRCNGHFWRILSITANFLPPGFVQTFINGVAAVGENSGASAFMPGAIGSISKVSDTNAGDSADTIQDMSGGSDTKMGRFGAAKLFMKATVNPIAGTHWMWRMGTRMVVQIIEAAKAKRSVGSVFWNIIYDGRLDYKQLVATRMLNTCGGMALMAGYTSPLGKVTLHYCFAGVKATSATLDLVSVFLVDIPVMACICNQGEGRNQRNWIYSHCESPDGLRPLLRTMIDKQDQCGTALEMTTKNLTGVFDDVFGEMFAGTAYVGSVLDSLIAAIDPGKAGNCDNYNSNPYVVTLIPEPADYWRVCGTTSFCKLRCQQQIEAFEQMKPPAKSSRSSTSSRVVESLFFPSINQDTFNPFPGTGIAALTEMSSCEDADLRKQLCPQSSDRCMIVAGFPGSGRLLVSIYCIPSSIARGVSKSDSWESPGISGLNTDIQFASAVIGGGWLTQYGVIGLQDQLIQACLSAGCQEFAPTDVGATTLGFEQMQSLDSCTVVQVRTSDNGFQNYRLAYAGDQWGFTLLDSTNIWDQDLYHIVLTSQTSQSEMTSQQTKVLLLPYTEAPMQVCFLGESVNSVTFERCTRLSDFERQNVPVKTKGKQSRVSRYAVSSNPKAFTVFLSSNDASHWLRILSIDISDTKASAVTKASIPATVTTTKVQTCSLSSCIGCTQLAVQRLCFAAQQCQVARCIGSQVNQLRPLCAVGAVTESSYFAMLAGIQGVWSIIASTLVTIIQTSGGLKPPKSIDWPDQVFYGLVCSMKDIVASQISIITSTVNGIIQSSVPVASAALGEPVDNSYLAMFSLTMTSVTNFLFQLALAPLYAAIAVQKVMVCQANSLMGVITEGDNHISIGDPDIQTASSAAAGMCLTQVFSENAQGTNSGMDADQAFATGSSQLLMKLGGLSLSLPLDAMKHPMDVLFTYAQGVILGLQDILQTFDQRK
jgi:hypothetical protein